jgi:hypothetical protein
MERWSRFAPQSLGYRTKLSRNWYYNTFDGEYARYFKRAWQLKAEGALKPYCV